LQEYRRSYSARMMLGAMAGTAAVAGAPITPAQMEQLVPIMMNAEHPAQPGGMLHEIDWPAVDAQARLLLSDAQFRAFTTFEGSDWLGSRFQNQIGAAHLNAQRADAAKNAPQTARSPRS
jgi:hypothetical protein